MLFARFRIELWALRRFVNRKWNLWKQLKARIATNVAMPYTILDKIDIYENANDQILTERNIHRSIKKIIIIIVNTITQTVYPINPPNLQGGFTVALSWIV